MEKTPLRSSKDFRIIFVSGVITYIGSMITYVAVPFQVAAMTGSYVAVDRRVMVITTQAAGGALALVLRPIALSPQPQIAVLYGVDLGTFAVSILLLWRLYSVRPDAVGARPSMRNVADGVRYAMSRKDLPGTYAVDLIAMAFAFPYAHFPFLAAEL